MFCIITGQEFTGKTSLVDNYISSKNLKKFIRLYVTKSLDLKTLIGNYVCSEKLGEFEWRDGPLAAAYKQGYLLILENLDSAKDEFYQMINSAIEGTLDIRGGEKVSKHPNFKILGTWQTPTSEEVLKVKRIVDMKPFISSLNLESTNLELVMTKHEKLKNSTLMQTLIKNLFNFSKEYSTRVKNHCLSATVLELERLCDRLSYSLDQVYGDRSPMNFSLQFKMLLIQAYIEVFFGALREDLPSEIYQSIGTIFDLIP